MNNIENVEKAIYKLEEAKRRLYDDIEMLDTICWHLSEMGVDIENNILKEYMEQRYKIKEIIDFLDRCLEQLNDMNKDPDATISFCGKSEAKHNDNNIIEEDCRPETVTLPDDLFDAFDIDNSDRELMICSDVDINMHFDSGADFGVKGAPEEYLSDMYSMYDRTASSAPEHTSFFDRFKKNKKKIPIPECNVKKSCDGVGNSSKAKEPTFDDVQFRAAAPDGIRKGTYAELKILMYDKEDYREADRVIERMGNNTKETSSGIFSMERGRRLRIVIQSPDIPIEDDMAEIVWNGKLAECGFELFVPENYEGKQIRIKGRVYDGQAVITDLKLFLNVGDETLQDIIAEQCKLCSAFVSYASKDRSKVVARIQGIQAARKDLDIFLDVENLRCGENWQPRLFYEIENRNIFYLFWSANAKDSEWVKKELEYAISAKGIDAIEPIPLEPPEICPPPEALSCKHFNDWTLRYMNE